MSRYQDAPSASTPEEPPATKTTKRRRPVLRGFLIVLTGLLVILLAFAGYYFYRVNRAMESLDRNETMMPSAENRPPAASPAPDAKNPPVTFVLIGSDERDGEYGLSDVLMVGYLSGDRDNFYLISFPRDLWVEIPGHGQSKINAAYAYGGSALSVQTLEEILDTRMDHVVGIDFEGFIKLTTVLGGVTIDNPYESSAAGYYWPKGKITIQGEEALHFVRNRDGLPDGDLSRAERQRLVISAMIDEVVSAGMLSNPAKMGGFLDAAAGTVKVDAGLTNDKIYALARQVGFSGSSSIKNLQAPIEGLGTSADGQSIVLADWAGMADLAKAMQTDQMAEYYATHGS